ncbi:MAG: TIGR00341 family protein [Rubricoccaceae bacterium]|nr:TIGR00341 family protein [Rubricoccaceae bacterium]
MSTRLLHVVVPENQLGSVENLLEPVALQQWHGHADRQRVQISAVVSGKDVEHVVDDLERTLSAVPDVLTAVTPVEAVLGAGLESKAPPPEREPTKLERFFSRNRLSTEELYEDIESGTQLTLTFLVFVITSAIIAALGMRSGQVAVVIGAMVIAPFLSPAMAMAMAATVGDIRLGRRALLATLAGSALAFVATVVLGLLVHIDPSVSELASRTAVSNADIGLALASGVAGVIAFCRGLSASLVGVMIAVALVPPLAAAGLLVGGGEIQLATNALILFLTNLVCINVAGIATFLFQGLPPKNWRLTGGVFAVWVLLLLLLAFLVIANVAT